jgi:hypothetical protein
MSKQNASKQERKVGNEASAGSETVCAPLDVAAERRVLDELIARREAQLHRRTELEVERKSSAHAALALRDVEAGRVLDRVTQEAFKLDQHVAALTDAIAEQERVVVRAEQVAAKEAEREKLLQLRGELTRFVTAGRATHQALATFVAAQAELRAALNAMHELGCSFPSGDQLRVLGGAAVHTALMETLWGRDIGRHLAPGERKTFAGLVIEWSKTIERGIDARLADGEQTSTPEVAA